MKPIRTVELVAAIEATSGHGVVDIERRPSRYATSAPLEEISADLSDGTALRLVLKDLTPGALMAGVRRAKPRFLREPGREVAVYRELLPKAPRGTARCYAATAARGRHWLLLEHVPGVELRQVGDLDLWRDAARWLARLHARSDLADRARSLPVRRENVGTYRRWLHRAIAYGPCGGDRGHLRQLADDHAVVVSRLTSLPEVLIHGEAYASNILVDPNDISLDDGGARVCPVDWEMAALGPGILDLAALTSGDFSAEEAEAIVAAYREAASPGCGVPTDDADFDFALTCARLHLAVQWLGWSPTWVPPLDHIQDWNGEAVALADQLRATVGP